MAENTNPYLDLYSAIWKQATKDEIRKEKKRFYKDLENALEEDNTEVLDKLYKSNENELIKLVRFKVLREAQAWGKIIGADKEYEKKYTELVKGILGGMNIERQSG